MSNIKLFQDRKIRSVWDETEQQWYFSVVDVVAALTDSVNPTDYLKKMRKRYMKVCARSVKLFSRTKNIPLKRKSNWRI